MGPLLDILPTTFTLPKEFCQVREIEPSTFSLGG